MAAADEGRRVLAGETSSLSVFADYRQFYLQGEPAHTPEGLWVDPPAFLDTMAVREGVVAAGTARNCEVPVGVRMT